MKHKTKVDNKFSVGERVYYRDNGETDTGTVIGLLTGELAKVIWDADSSTGEKVDIFKYSQLCRPNVYKL